LGKLSSVICGQHRTVLWGQGRKMRGFFDKNRKGIEGQPGSAEKSEHSGQTSGVSRYCRGLKNALADVNQAGGRQLRLREATTLPSWSGPKGTRRRATIKARTDLNSSAQAVDVLRHFGTDQQARAITDIIPTIGASPKVRDLCQRARVLDSSISRRGCALRPGVMRKIMEAPRVTEYFITIGDSKNVA